MRLSDFPVDVLAHILNGEVSYASILFWKSGDRQMMEKLSKGGITHVELEDSNERVPGRWPRCLKNFKLSSLSIAQGHGFESLAEVHNELRQLHQSLEKLELLFIGALKAIFPTTSSVLRRQVSHYQSITEGDDNVEIEELSSISSGTSRKRAREEDVDDEQMLPLKDGSYDSNKRMKLGEGSMDQSFGNMVWNMNSTHPRLRHLTINPRFETVTLDACLLPHLPTSLETLTLYTIDISGEGLNFQALFPQLMEFNLHACSLPKSFSLECLPASLVRSNIVYRVEHIPLAYSIPSRITSLTITDTTTTSRGAILQPLLPPTLTHFAITPDSLTGSDISSFDPLLWPPSLTSFCAKLFQSQYPYLPRGLKILKIQSPLSFSNWIEESEEDESDDEPDSQFAFLEAGRNTLNSIDAQKWSNIKEYLFEDALTMENNGIARMEAVHRYITKVEKGALYGLPLSLTTFKACVMYDEEFSSFILPPNLTSADMGLYTLMTYSTTFFDLLPSSLTHLGIYSSMPVDREEGVVWKIMLVEDARQLWLYNHPNLKSMSFPARAAHISNDSYPEMHCYTKILPRGLVNLEILARDLDVGPELEFLPPKLTRLALDSSRSTPQESWLSYLPPGLKHLVVSSTYFHPTDFAQLPPSLESFSCTLNNEDPEMSPVPFMNALPASLRSFRMADLWDGFSFDAIGPRSRFVTLSPQVIRQLLATDASPRHGSSPPDFKLGRCPCHYCETILI